MRCDKSQCFLVDKKEIQAILEIARVKADELIFEVGPGKGAITLPMLEAGAKVIAVEIDTDLASRLSHPRLTLYHGDIMKFDLKLLPSCKVVANLPFYITTDILEKLIPHPTFTSFTVLVQKEAAERFLAEPRTKPYNAFTLLLRYFVNTEIPRIVDRSCFSPSPRVDGAVVHFTPKPHPPVDSHQFIKIVKQAFAKRRKMLRHTFGDRIPFATARPEDLNLDEWVELVDVLINPSRRGDGPVQTTPI